MIEKLKSSKQIGRRKTSSFNLHFAARLLESFTLCSKAVMLVELDTAAGELVVLAFLDEDEGELEVVGMQDDGADGLTSCVRDVDLLASEDF